MQRMTLGGKTQRW